jgi:hypothetical protein
MQQDEDELQCNNSVADVAQGIGCGLHLLAVGVDGEVTLSHRMEIVTQEDGARGLIRLVDAGDRCPQLSGLIWGLGEIEDIVPDGVEEPIADTGVSSSPGRIGRACLLRAINVQKKAEFAAEGEEEGRPASEVRALRVEGDWC